MAQVPAEVTGWRKQVEARYSPPQKPPAAPDQSGDSGQKYRAASPTGYGYAVARLVIRQRYGLVFPAVGHREWSGVNPRREVPPSDRKDPLKDAAIHSRILLSKIGPGKDDDVILQESMEDAEKGFATQPMSANELQRTLRGAEHSLIRRFVITQATGKKRIIDDAAEGGQSEVSTDENALGFCSALQPAHHIWVLVQAMRKYGHEGLAEEILSGGEDWPDAYRYTPMKQEEATSCAVVWWHPMQKEPESSRYTMGSCSASRTSRIIQQMVGVRPSAISPHSDALSPCISAMRLCRTPLR